MRLIDRHELRKALEDNICADCEKDLNNLRCGVCLMDVAIEYIIAAPAIDAVEVVRCKDCAHRRNSHLGWYCGYEYDRSDPYEMTRRADDENYYCADAERRF